MPDDQPKEETVLEQFYLAIGSNAWGVANSAKEALAIHRKERGRKMPCVVYKAPMGIKKIWVDDLGFTEFTTAEGFDALEISKQDWEVARIVE